MDGMLGFVEHVYGTAFAQNAADVIEYPWNSNSSWDPYGKIWGVPGA
jgi:hypothetical protein